MNLPLYSTSEAISRRRMRYAWVNMSTISVLVVSTLCEGGAIRCVSNGTGISTVIVGSASEDFLAK